ncbi:MAG: hypothetical protein COV30_02460 [Candidatus Yanofskybacteria bacterium CG10_big_fil_rev_8_21_14_0_10_37_15]|uniref:Uncharacterized protein n=1 Tax=Candidatus Yanofskybacteria bacterium CG10_big_fil_rev_8_21_14_0_10_37_15 TaxID=1975097 RepID=A0A2H0R582_9BACT|nr:MAG: hypothetical protein COV30_02460 [Candidatus Yanofskybacteria bacterium CG10_big_fil_rev_8_21_14_0_10_37_15]
MKLDKKNIRKIKNATKEELAKLQEEYETLLKDVRGMSPAGLLVIAAAGVAVILFFRNNFLDFIGLVMILYPLYIFIQRGAHRKGYFEGYYDLMTKINKRSEHENPENSN